MNELILKAVLEFYIITSVFVKLYKSYQNDGLFGILCRDDGVDDYD